MTGPRYKLVLGDLIVPVHDTRCRVIRSGGLVLERCKQGYDIIACGTRRAMEQHVQKKRSIERIDYGRQVLMPPFFDMHFHWVQDAVCSMPKDSLLTWLEEHTWPYEATFKEKTQSLRRARALADTLLQVGTLGGMVYASIHPHTTDHALQSFVGDYYVGNVAMTMESPPYLIQTPEEAIATAKKGFARYGKRYVATPRFAPSTHPEVMRALGKLQGEYQGFMQTHLSETKREIRWVLSLFKEFDGFQDVQSYLEVYDRCGLLSARSIFGHGIYLSDQEWKLLKKKRSAIAHCPTSNAPCAQQGLGSGLFDFKRADAEGVSWMLATDIGAGPFLSMIDVLRSFVKQNRKKKRYEATYTRALFRSTIASARFLGLQATRGSFLKGREGSFLVLPPVPESKSENAESILEHLFETQIPKREQCMTFVRETWYRGEPQFQAS